MTNLVRNPIINKYGCTNTVGQYIHGTYDTKVIDVKCGTTDLDGSTLTCDSCWKEWHDKHPNGLTSFYGGDDDYDDGIL